jgi:hypothetical protein
MSKLGNQLLLTLCAVAGLTVPVAGQELAVATSTAACKTCTCYFTSDCSSGQTCGSYGSCTKSGKLDGVCSGGGVAVWGVGELSAVSAAIDAYFDAFTESSRNLTGTAVPAAAGRLRVANAQRLSLDGHVAVRNLALDALDLAIGFDLVRENERLCPVAGPVPTVRGDMTLASDALVDAVRQGLENAIELNDPAQVVAPLQAFWATYPSYAPHHTGRCYDHGHADYTYVSPLDCQMTELQNLLRLYLPGSAAPLVEAIPANKGRP